MPERGHLVLARVRGVPVRAHWTLPIGALVFTRFRFEPAAWAAIVLLVLIHEAGHAAWVARYRLHVVAIDVHGYGGVCRWAGGATPWQRAVIAWGGILAQALVLVATTTWVSAFGYPGTLIGRQVIDVFTETNFLMMALNLLPFAPLDGKEAWKIVGEGWRRLSSRRRRQRLRVQAKQHFPVDEEDPELSPEAAARVEKLFEDALRKKH